MNTRREIVRNLRSPNNETALQALELVRQRGWLQPDSRKLAKRDLSGADLSGGSFDNAYLFKVIFRNARLIRTSWVECVLDLADFENVELLQANLRQAYCNYVNFRSANLGQASCIKGMFTGANFSAARLDEADFTGANLDGVTLTDANLTNTILDDASLATAEIATDLVTTRQLARTRMMGGATLPDGSRYDGRFRLKGDIEFARSIGIDVNNPEAMAERYQVSVETYLAGQRWADENLKLMA
jgi:uncharacterized protein YjbI with pentapeptide repeats